MHGRPPSPLSFEEFMDMIFMQGRSRIYSCLLFFFFSLLERALDMLGVYGYTMATMTKAHDVLERVCNRDMTCRMKKKLIYSTEAISISRLAHGARETNRRMTIRFLTRVKDW